MEKEMWFLAHHGEDTLPDPGMDIPQNNGNFTDSAET